jgi:hypothetical protein
MSWLCAVGHIRHFGARHLISKLHPGSRHAKPKDHCQSRDHKGVVQSRIALNLIVAVAPVAVKKND